jgi:DNA-binding NarL/FixJ family response regulator
VGEDHSIVRVAVRALLEGALPGMTLLEAGTGAAVVEALREPVDLVILDIRLPDRLELLEEIHEKEGAPPVLIMSAHAELGYAIRALRAGAAGYVNKARAGEELVGAVRLVLEGGRYVGPELATALAAHLAAGEDGPLHDRLSPREVRVFQALVTGRSIKEIAYDLGLSPKTASTYRARIFEKLHVDSLAALVRYAIENDLT